MKKIMLLGVLCAVVQISCNKEDSKSDSGHTLQVSVTETSPFMQVSRTTFNSTDILDVQYIQAADSVVWIVTDSSSGNLNMSPGDSAGQRRDTTIIPPILPPMIPGPPGDSTGSPRDSTSPPPIVIPIDSSKLPKDSTYPPPPIIIPPPVDSSRLPGDSTNFPPPGNPDSLMHPLSGNGYSCSYNKNHLSVEISRSGTYLVQAAAYRKNSNGSYSLVQTGFVRLTAR
jgi:hypothetical protein